MSQPRSSSDLVCEELGTVTSTNDYLKSFVDEGRWRRVVAREQVQGRGQYDRDWHSAPDEGLYVSFLVYPLIELADAALLHEVSSLAVVGAITSLGKPLFPHLKEPNDVLIGSKKVAGILIELGTTEQRLNWCIIGIGVNLFQRSFPEALRGIATSLHLEGIEVQSRGGFCDSLTRELLGGFQTAAAGDRESLRAQYQRLLQ